MTYPHSLFYHMIFTDQDFFGYMNNNVDCVGIL